MKIYVRKKMILLLILLMLVSISACGTNSNLATPSTFNSRTSGNGIGPEPGTDNKPRPTPNGHSESIVVANGLAYIGSDNGTLYALGARDGMVHWQRQLGATVLVFSVVNDIVYATVESTVYAINAITGAPLWHFQTGKDISQLQVSDGVVYTNSAAEGNSSMLFAFGATDGVLLWRYSLSSVTPALLGIIDGIIYDLQTSGLPGQPNFQQILYALRTSDAHVLWHASLEDIDGLANSNVEEESGSIYIATGLGAVYAFRAATGMQLWHVAQSIGIGQGFVPGIVSLSMMNSIVFAGNSQGVDAYRASDGVQVWQYKEKVPYSRPFALQPVVVDGVVYFADNIGHIIALRATDGTQLWQHDATGVFTRPMTVVNGLVIDDSGPVYALRASDGNQVWLRSLAGSGEFSGAGPPEVVGEGVVFVGSDDGSVQAIQVNDGESLWRYVIKERAVPTTPVFGAGVQFTAATSYQQALEIVTGLGLKTFAECHFSWALTDDKNIFSSSHFLTVAAKVNSAPLWLDRLNQTPGVDQALAAGEVIHCTLIPLDIAPRLLTSEQAGTFLRVTFTQGTQYTSALDTMNAFGFRLADPCYEQARALGIKPVWHLMGQADSFVQTRTLLLATTSINAITWMDQLSKIAGVEKIVSPYKLTC
jgi:eukaryotic-like serine/threonine-protein kinase